MGALIAGLALMALAVFDLVRNRVGADAVLVTGTVTEVVTQRSRTAGRKRPMYGSAVRYTDPQTGTVVDLEPQSFGKPVHQVGDSVLVALHADGREPRVVQQRPWMGFAVLGSFGLVMIGLQVLEWAR